ncbi:MAG: hypothetical protein K940chlam2_01074 [Chlamydiae bacterium]|nr:hypothetical protein [Chlamydiota bacterium]
MIDSLKTAFYTLCTGVQSQGNIFTETAEFGPQDWGKYFEIQVSNSSLPSHLRSYLDQPCPFWENQTVKQTHYLFFIPENLPDDLSHLSNSVSKLYSCKAAQSLEGPYWGLITKKPIPDSSGKTFSAQQELIKSYSGYRIPKVNEAMLAINTAFLKEDVRYFQGAGGQTHCEETSISGWPLAIGSMSNGKTLEIETTYGDWDESNGIAVITGKNEVNFGNR